MADSCDFGKLLNTPCDKRLYARQKGRKNIKEFGDDLQCILFWRARLLEERDNELTICFNHENFLRRYLRESLNNVAAFYNLEMAKILKEKGFNDLLPGQKLCRQFATEGEKLTKPSENENMTEIIETESSQDEITSDDDFLLYESPKRET